MTGCIKQSVAKRPELQVYATCLLLEVQEEEKAQQEEVEKKQAEEKLQEAIPNMKKKNLDIKLIASIMGLKEEEIEKI